MRCDFIKAGRWVVGAVVIACGCGAAGNAAMPQTSDVTDDIDAVAQVTDTHKVVSGVTKQAEYWHFPPSNDSGLYNYLFELDTSAHDLETQIPGFKASTAKPFVFGPSKKGQAWTARSISAFSTNSGLLESTGQFYTSDLDLTTLTGDGVAFGVDVPASGGGLERYWFQGPKQNATLQIEN
jgi:hypothetical protein